MGMRCLAILIAVISLLADRLLAAPTGLRVAIYSGTGANADTTLALYRAVAAIGHTPLAITKADIVNGRLSTTNFNAFIIPAGEDGKRCCAGHFSDVDDLGALAEDNAIRAYLNAGGGVVGIEAGAFYSSKNGGTLDIFLGNFTDTQPIPARQTYTIVDPAFGNGVQVAWQSVGGGYFSSLPTNAVVVARNTATQPVIVRAPYGAGRVALTAPCLELRGDSEDDWTIWDNWAMGGVHSNSVGAWKLLGRLINWAATGDSSEPTVSPAPNPTGARVAVVATHTSDGGAWPGLLPAVARSIEFAGHVPLAIRFEDIQSNRLTHANFNVVTFPGGYAYGYKTGLAGHEQEIRDFISNGGAYYGICAGSFYAPATIQWQGSSYSYPLTIFQGQDVGPIDDIIAWPGFTLTPITIHDPVLGNLGTIQELYYGGGYHTIPTLAQQGAPVYTAATFAYTGTAAGKPDVVRYTYGNGRVLLITTHPEVRAGSDEDWLFWDNYAYDGVTPVTNPDNPWQFVSAAFNRWLVPPPPQITALAEMPGGNWKLQFTGTSGLSYRVQASSNLVQWADDGYGAELGGVFEHTWTNNFGAATLFFRVVVP
jgi:glutamine amidotransferase-like uncharacterized protein